MRDNYCRVGTDNDYAGANEHAYFGNIQVGHQLPKTIMNTQMLYSNRLTALPEWLTELPSIERVCADHNFIKALPERFVSRARRHLCY